MNLKTSEEFISVVIPCLNEADTLEKCILWAKEGIEKSGIQGEIIVSDNGSTDGSIEIAERQGVRIIEASDRGYGYALMSGIEAAKGCYIVMGDADCSYDFREIPNFLKKLREGCDLVQGCRFPSGGGTIEKGAMPISHRLLGNPMFSFMTRKMFQTHINDVYCGLRAFRKEHYERLDQKCGGMEFAVEMVIKSSMIKAKIGEIPITLHPDERIAHAPHLKTVRDGLKTLRFLLVSSPRWLFFIPGIGLILMGLAGYFLGLPPLTVGAATFGVHTLLVASMLLICGYQAILFSIVARTFGVVNRLILADPWLDGFYKRVHLSTGLIWTFLFTLAGLFLISLAFFKWYSVDFGPLPYAQTLRIVVPGVTFITIAVQTLMAGFLVSIMGMRHRH